MNRWRIPKWLEDEVRDRDITCVYCGVQLIEKAPIGGTRRNIATWEHIINDARIITRDNIARCCNACNSSKGTKPLNDWMKSRYCAEHRITKDTVADIVKKALTKKAEQGVPDYDPQAAAMQSLSLATIVYSTAVGRA